MSIVRAMKNLSLQAKITGLVAALLLTLAGSGAFALASMSMINHELTAITEQDLPLTAALTDVTVKQLEQAIWMERALRHGEEMVSQPNMRRAFDAAWLKFRDYSTHVDKALAGAESLVQRTLSRTRAPEQVAAFTHVSESLKAIDAAHDRYGKHADELLVALDAGRVESAMKMAESVIVEEQAIDHAMEQLLGEISRFTATAAKAAEAHEHHAKNVLYGILAVALLVGLASAWWVVRDMVGRLSYAVTVAETVASGDLRNPVSANGGDEVGRVLVALGAMRDKLHDMVMEMHQSSDGLAVAAEELATATSQLSSGVHSQRSELELAATAFNQMSSTVKDVASNAGTTAAATHEACDAASSGKQVICRAVKTIRGLAESVEGASEVISRLGNDSESIGAVIDVIKSIAEQTNLLALNAAIEAARAGEQGRGFAVVADEVRTLAQRTQASTQEIEDMIDRLQGSARSAVQSMEGGRAQAKESVDQAMAAGQSLETINASMSAINDMNTQIASAAEEQAAVTEDINRNLTAIRDSSEQSATAMTQTSGASDELARMAASLQSMIARFQVA